MRKKLFYNEYKIKLTGIYEIGRQFGDTTSTAKLTTFDGGLTNYTIKSKGLGRNTYYITTYGSLMMLPVRHKSKFKHKFQAGYTATLKRHRKSHTVTIRIEQRWQGGNWALVNEETTIRYRNYATIEDRRQGAMTIQRLILSVILYMISQKCCSRE